jgi:hypothetical protein
MLALLLIVSAGISLLAALGVGLAASHGPFGWAVVGWTAIVQGAAVVWVAWRGRRVRDMTSKRHLPEWVGFQSVKITRRLRPFTLLGLASLIVMTLLGVAVENGACPVLLHGLASGVAVGLNLGPLFVAWASLMAHRRFRRQLEVGG